MHELLLKLENFAFEKRQKYENVISRGWFDVKVQIPQKFLESTQMKSLRSLKTSIWPRILLPPCFSSLTTELHKTYVPIESNWCSRIWKNVHFLHTALAFHSSFPFQSFSHGTCITRLVFRSILTVFCTYISITQLLYRGSLGQKWCFELS